MKIIQVEWEDAVTYRGPKKIKDVKKLGPAIMRSAGFEVGSDDENVRIVQKYRKGPETAGNIQVIPRKLIRDYKLDLEYGGE